MYGTSMNFPGGIFGELERISRELDAMFGQPSAALGIRASAMGAFPPINVGTTPTSTEVFVFAPGVDPKKVDLTLEKGVLTISGERLSDVPDESEKLNVYRHQRPYGKFRRAIAVPEDVDTEHVTANYRDGVLTISLKRSAAAQPKRISVS